MKNNRFALSLLGATFALGVVSPLHAADSGSLSSDDKKFIEKAAQGGMAEVELGKLAGQKGKSADVKKFGAQMVGDHSKANEELKRIASSKGVQPPAAIDSGHQRDMDKLAKLSGAEFDKAYIDNMVDDHKKDISEFEKQAKSGKDADLKAFASKTLPTLREHMKMVEATRDAIKNEK